jgi:hypothetical protein
MRNRCTILVPLLVVSAVGHAQIVQYTAPGGSFNPTAVAARATATALDDVGSSADLQPGVGLADTVFLQQNVVSVDAAAAVANQQWFQFKVRCQIGFHLNLTSLAFDATRGGASTPRGWVLRSSVDNFGSNLGTAVIPTQNPTLTPFNVGLTGAAFQNLTAETVFRIYGYGPSTGIGCFYDNITLSGAVEEDPILVKYTAPGGSFTPTTIGNNVLAGNLNDFGSSGDLQPGVGMADTVFLQQNGLATDPSQAVANNQFFQFNIAPDAGMELDMSSITFDAARGGASTPRGWVVRSSLDGFASDIGTDVVPSQNPNLTAFGIDLSGLSLFQNVTSQVTFRIYGYAPTTGVGMFYDNIAVHGSVQAVPEPGTLAVLGIGALVALRRRRRQA